MTEATASADRIRKTYSQAQRLLRIYLALANARAGLTVQELIERTGVTRRTINRDLAVLHDDHLVRCVHIDDRGRKRWSILPAGPAGGVTFTRGELLALCLGRSMLSFAQGTELYASMSDAFQKVADRLGSRDIEALDLDRKLFAVPDAPPINIETEAFDDCLNELLTAVLRSNQIEIDYPSSRGDAVRTWLVDPLTLAYYRGRLYLVARVRDGDTIRLFAVHRVIDARWLRNTTIDVPDGYRPASLFSNRFGIFQGSDPTTVAARFSAGPARYARERLWHASQQCIDLADGGCELKWNVPVTPELVSWLLSFGAGVAVLEPATLRERIATTLREAAGRYGT